MKIHVHHPVRHNGVDLAEGEHDVDDKVAQALVKQKLAAPASEKKADDKKGDGKKSDEKKD